MSNAVWAMATMARRHEALQGLVAAEAVRRGMGASAPQAVSNLVWGFAVLEHSCPPFMQARSCMHDLLLGVPSGPSGRPCLARLRCSEGSGLPCSTQQ